MRAERLELRHFRNLKETCWQPGPGVNVIWGENAQGKTNLLEALWLFTGSRSFRGAKDGELVALGQEESRLSLAFLAEEREQEAILQIRSRRSAELNGLPQPDVYKRQPMKVLPLNGENFLFLVLPVRLKK